MHKARYSTIVYLISFEHYLKRHMKPINVRSTTEEKEEKIFQKGE